MLEKDIEKALRLKLKAVDKRILCLKFESPGFTGVPDRIILLPNEKIIFAELKQRGKKERVRQEYVQGLIRDLGFEVQSSVDSIERVNDIIKECEMILRNG